jgi:hypothetical protein
MCSFGLSSTQRLVYGPSRRATLVVHIPYQYFEETQDPSVTSAMVHSNGLRIGREESRLFLAGLFRKWERRFVFDEPFRSNARWGKSG